MNEITKANLLYAFISLIFIIEMILSSVEIISITGFLAGFGWSLIVLMPAVSDYICFGKICVEGKHMMLPEFLEYLKK